jgi:IS30 family transposase
VFHEGVVPLLRKGWSPEQISGTFRKSHPVSHEWLYQRILKDKQEGGDAYRYLRCQKKRKKRYGKPDRRGQIAHRVPISARPPVVETRSRVGDWEADTVIGAGHKGAIVTLVERKTGYAKLVLVPNKEAAGVTQAILKALFPLRDRVLTLTFDNGKEFAWHQKIAKALEADCYFAEPYSSWQRGSNENLNGLLRQYFPKGTDFRTITKKQLADVEKKLNDRPRKRLQ